MPSESIRTRENVSWSVEQESGARWLSRTTWVRTEPWTTLSLEVATERTAQCANQPIPGALISLLLNYTGLLLGKNRGGTVEALVL